MRKRIWFFALPFVFALILCSCEHKCVLRKKDYSRDKDYHYDICDVCGEASREEHKYDVIVAKTSTCNQTGEKLLECKVCGYSKTEIIELCPHTPKNVDAVEATCIKNGKTAGIICNVCQQTIEGRASTPTVEHNFVDGICTMCDSEIDELGLFYQVVAPNTLKVSAYKSIETEKLVIPSRSPSGRTVTVIGNFARNDNIVSVAIPDTVTEIAEDAFSCCTALKEIVIPESVKAIKDYAFYRCTSLESLVIPNSVDYIGVCAFQNSGLVSVVLPKGLTMIQSAVFQGTKLNEIVIPEHVESILHNAFSGTLLSEVVIPASVKEIYSAFEECERLEKVTFLGEVQYFGYSGFAKTDIKEFIFPDNIKEVRYLMFDGCESLEYVMLPKDMQTMYMNAFNGCKKLEKLHYNGTVADFGKVFINFGSYDSIYTGGITEVECTDGIFELDYYKYKFK